MTVHPRKAILASSAMAGAAMLGLVFSGSASAAVPGVNAPGSGLVKAPAKHNDSNNDDDTGGGTYTGQFHHDHHGASDLYDFDLYNPTEHYDENKCRDKNASRHPMLAMNSGISGYNGDASDDCKYDSSDYDKSTGYQGDKHNKDGGYNGYLGSNSKRLDKNSY